MASTNKELVEILEERNKGGRYDELIQRAKDDVYHDFKSDYALPKSQLIYDMHFFPELEDVIIRVIKAEFDESGFESAFDESPGLMP
jgi:dTDP-D-glucose 4,6-dehydratase